MEPALNKKSYFSKNHFLIDHIIDFNFQSDSFIKYKKDENEQKLFDFISGKEKFQLNSYGQKEIYCFLSSKLKAMEKMNLDDECCFEGKIETRKINIDKNIFPKSKPLKFKKSSISPKNKTNKKRHSKKNSVNKNYYKNIVIDANGRIERSSMKSIDLVKAINSGINKEIKGKDLNLLLSDKVLLNSLINEIKGK